MGWEFWEEFWKYLLKWCRDNEVYFADKELKGGTFAEYDLKILYLDFEEKWMNGQVELPPLRESVRVPPKR